MTAVTVDGEQPAYRDPGLLVDERVESLLEMMTLEEKVAQLGSAWVFQLTEKGQFSREKAGPLLRQGLGHVTRISGASDLTPRERGPTRQRDPALPPRGDPSRHPGHRP